jgi:hypothetical protein
MMKVKTTTGATIVQFVCFETNTGLDQFVTEWDSYVKKFLTKDIAFSLQEQSGKKCRYKYISMNKWPEDNFQFVFMQGRLSDHFYEGRVKVVQAGGYSPIQVERSTEQENLIKIIAFLKDGDCSAYTSIPGYDYLNIYQAYYQNCLYTYVLEFFVHESRASEVYKQLTDSTVHIEAGIYSECVLQSA